jgi:hypothetical protein
LRTCRKPQTTSSGGTTTTTEDDTEGGSTIDNTVEDVVEVLTGLVGGGDGGGGIGGKKPGADVTLDPALESSSFFVTDPSKIPLSDGDEPSGDQKQAARVEISLKPEASQVLSAQQREDSDLGISTS